MPINNLEPKVRAEQYARERGINLTGFLGDGTDGTVWKSDRNTAVKSFIRSKNYLIEIGCYQRLRSRNVTKICGLAVPRLVDYDQSLWIVEMGIVSPPRIIDFGKAYLDEAPEHTPEVWQDYIDQQKEWWEDRFSDVQAILYQLRQLGIYYQDPSPRNIDFGDRDE